MTYSLKVKPLKDEGKAEIEISFKDFSAEILLKESELLSSENNSDLLSKKLISENVFVLEVKYSAQENFLKQLEENLNNYPGMAVESKKILIEKLGGWFDF